MKKLIMLSIPLSVMIIIMLGMISEKTPQTSGFELILRDNNGDAVPLATVTLYSSETDYMKKVNNVGAATPVKTLFSDDKGKLQVTDLPKMDYYCFAEKGCNNNVNGKHKITSDETDKPVKIILTQTGILKAKNNSKGTCQLWINGNAKANINPSESWTNYYYPIGSCAILFKAKKDKSQNISVGCGATLEVSYP